MTQAAEREAVLTTRDELLYQDAAIWVLEELDRYDYDSLMFNEDPYGKEMMAFIYALITQIEARSEKEFSDSIKGMSEYVSWHSTGNSTGKLTDFETYVGYYRQKAYMGTFVMDMHGKVVVSKPLWWKYLTGETE